MEEFINNTNKALLWGLLYEQKIFDNIPDEHVKQIKYIFDKEIQNISQTQQNLNTSLMELNKTAIQVISGRVQVYKQENSYFQDKKKDLELSLNKKQAEFDSLMNQTIPEEPNFTDQKDKPFNKNNMEELLQQMISSREKQLNQVLILESDSVEKKSETHEPVREQTQDPLQTQVQDTLLSTPILKIGSNLLLAEDNIVNISQISNNIDIPKSNKKKHILLSDNYTNYTNYTNQINRVENEDNENNEDNEESEKSNKFLQGLKKLSTEKIINNEYMSEQKFNEQTKLDTILNKLHALTEKVSHIERIMENRDSLSSRSSFGSISLSPPK